MKDKEIHRWAKLLLKFLNDNNICDDFIKYSSDNSNHDFNHDGSKYLITSHNLIRLFESVARYEEIKIGIDIIREIISLSFLWEITDQGDNFWSAIYTNWNKIVDNTIEDLEKSNNISLLDDWTQKLYDFLFYSDTGNGLVEIFIKEVNDQDKVRFEYNDGSPNILNIRNIIKALIDKHGTEHILLKSIFDIALHWGCSSVNWISLDTQWMKHCNNGFPDFEVKQETTYVEVGLSQKFTETVWGQSNSRVGRVEDGMQFYTIGVDPATKDKPDYTPKKFKMEIE